MANEKTTVICIEKNCYEKALENSNYCSAHDPLRRNALKDVMEKINPLFIREIRGKFKG